MPVPENSRRKFLKSSLITGSLLGASVPLIKLGATPGGATLESATAEEKGDADFSFLHLTDMHVKRKRKGNEGYKRCIEKVNGLENRPDLVLMGGDGAFDGMYTPKEEYLDQLALFKSISDQMEMPWYPCLGNHDTFGLSSRRKTTPDDPDIGKDLFLKAMGIKKSYYSFDHKGWHFVVLDSIEQVETEEGPSQTHAIDQEQLEWLRFDLGQHYPKPTVVVLHVAAFCHIGQYTGDQEAKAMNAMVIKNTLELRHILERHSVKAVLQGHSHIPEDYFYNGIWYLTSPSVSAAWWGGNWKGYPPGFTQLYVKEDKLSWERISFDWEHHLEPEDELERKKIKELEEFNAQQERLKAKERA